MKTRGRRTALGIAVATTAAAVAWGAPTGAAVAQVAPTAGYTGGFTSSAIATPLRIEIYEPSIPIPSDPQAELNFSYTKVTGSSGPSSTARASAMWPGDAVGEGLKVIVEQAGLPPQLGANGYPVQVNAQFPGDTDHAEQEPLPGTVERVRTDDSGAVARAGYSSDGQVAGDGSGGSSGESQGSGGQGGGSPLPGLPGAPGLPGLPGAGSTGAADPLTALSQGDLSALGGALTGSSGNSSASTGSAGNSSVTTAGDPPPSSPLGALGAVIGVDGLSSSSRTDYSAASDVSATAAASLGELRLAGGVVTLRGVDVSAVTDSALSGATAKPAVSYGVLSIAGTPFKLTSDGFEAAGNTSAIPGLPDAPKQALAKLGIAIELPKPEKQVKGSSAMVTAAGPKITFDTGVLRSKLPSLPIGEITKNFPDSAKQLKSLLLSANEAHPKFVIYAGHVVSSVETVAGITFPTGAAAAAGHTNAGTPASGGSGAAVASPGSSAPAGLGAPSTGGAAGAAPAASSTPVQNVSATPGLPPLGSVPGMLTLGGLALAGAAGWWFRRGMAVLFGGAGMCPHGLASGLPDLRKV